MLGYMALSEDRGEGRLRMERILGLSLLRCGVPAGAGFWKDRRVRRAAEGFSRRGVRRVLTGERFPHWALLEDRGLRRVDYAPLCQAMAAPLALAWLERQGTAPVGAAVELRGSRVSRPLRLAAQALCGRVRSLIITAPSGGRELADELRREWGMAVVEEGRSALTLCFSPWGEKGDLRLYGAQPWLDGLSLALRERELPEEPERLPLLEALWEGGAADLDDFRVIN